MKIDVRNLKKEFNRVKILNGIDITFEERKVYGLIGRNGSGKSVFLKILCALYYPTSGEVLFDNVNIIKENLLPPDTRALIEKPSFLGELSGFDNLKLLASIQNKISDKEILNTLEEVKLMEDKDKKYKYYSLGMKQKLGIAQVLMEKPKIMILDEPFNGIEMQTAIELRKVLKKEARNGAIVIVATHIKEDIDNLADEIWNFDGGLIKKVK